MCTHLELCSLIKKIVAQLSPGQATLPGLRSQSRAFSQAVALAMQKRRSRRKRKKNKDKMLGLVWSSNSDGVRLGSLKLKVTCPDHPVAMHSLQREAWDRA